MEFEVNSENPVVKAIVTGTAPHNAQLAAARGMLPLSQADLLEVLATLLDSKDFELASLAKTTFETQDFAAIRDVIQSDEIAPRVLYQFAGNSNLPQEIHESVVVNPKTPDEAILQLALKSTNGALLELVTDNQQRLIRRPDIIEAILKNPNRTALADRRAAETKREFFEKERGVQQIANEFRAQGNEAAAEFIEKAEFIENLAEIETEGQLSVEDAILLASHIETPDSEIDDSWLSLDLIEELYEESEEQRLAIITKIVGELSTDDELSNDRVSLIKKIMMMNMKDRIKLGTKGDREARSILIRDSNKIVCQAVMQNPRITENEVEKIANMRTVPDDVLRLIAINRNWARNYSIVHALARNPRTPLGNVMSILTRLQTRDLQAMSKNRNVSDAVRRQALRFANARAGR